MRLSGMTMVDGSGKPVDLRSASWRSGGVQSAYDADIPETLIMALGRWKSDAWRHYLVLSPFNFRGASLKMWEKARADAEAASRVVCMGSRPASAQIKAATVRVLCDTDRVIRKSTRRRRVLGPGGVVMGLIPQPIV
jgi:hypothetical protein